MAPADVIALFGPTGVGKTDVAIELANRLRERGERPVAVSADALQVYAGLELLTGAADAAGALPARAPADLVPARRRELQRRAVLRAGARRDRRGPVDRRTPDRGRRHRPLPARRADGAAPPATPAGGRPRALDGRARTPGTGRAAHGLARARAVGGGADRAHRLASGSSAPWSCWTPASSSPRRANRSCGPSDVRYPTLLIGLVMDRERLYARIDARVDAMIVAGAAERGPPRERRRRLGHRAQGAGLRGAADRRRRVDEAPHPQLRAPPADVDAQARRRERDRHDRPVAAAVGAAGVPPVVRAP